MEHLFKNGIEHTEDDGILNFITANNTSYLHDEEELAEQMKLDLPEHVKNEWEDSKRHFWKIVEADFIGSP